MDSILHYSIVDEGARLELRYENLSDRWVEQCAALELAAFPHADPEDLLSAEDLAAYARTFPQGFFVCHDGDRVVGQAGGIFVDFDFDHPQHTIAEITGEHQCGNHDPEGDWYYGTDIVVDTAYRRRGIGKRLYQLRKDLVKEWNRRGIIAGGYIPGFADHKHEMSAADYVKKVSAGELYDRTLSFQLENGFEARGVLANYIDSADIDGWAALIVWVNPDYS
ncbi:MAG: GNAT family N-acetyltransferase [Acidimicrobiia bacterium]|nr:GNAT family N-acetyltransferase [Acidimicrobiia bacterium]MDH5502625.1 GNAT family N-acetyltransferase [Acidimicrobiia bacterium]